MSRKNDLVVQEMDGEVLIYDLSENKAFCLNETSALVWQACDGNKSAAEISEFISQKLNSPANEDLVWFAIDQLKKEKLIENGDNLFDHFAGMSRRNVIKKVGLGTMIALPIVAGIVAPTSISAQSECAPGCTAQNLPANSPCTCNCECGSACCMANNLMCTGANNACLP